MTEPYKDLDSGVGFWTAVHVVSEWADTKAADVPDEVRRGLAHLYFAASKVAAAARERQQAELASMRDALSTLDVTMGRESSRMQQDLAARQARAELAQQIHGALLAWMVESESTHSESDCIAHGLPFPCWCCLDVGHPRYSKLVEHIARELAGEGGAKT